MADILACVDGSAYASSVCDHAGWFASDPDVGVEVLHVVESPAVNAPAEPGQGGAELATVPGRLVHRAVARLQEHGVGPVSLAVVEGSFVDIAAGRDAKMIVMGKRGGGSGAERRRLGSNVDRMIRATATPVCLTSQLFLPVHRALILLDADLAHRSAIDFVTAQPRFFGMRLDVVVICADRKTAEPKLDLARLALGAAGGEIFALPADDLDHAVMQYLEGHAADLVIVSRAVVAPDPQARLSQIEARGLWGTRTPVLIC